VAIDSKDSKDPRRAVGAAEFSSIAEQPGREHDAVPNVAKPRKLSPLRLDRWREKRGRRPMTVKTILSHKGTDVVTADPNATLGEAVQILAARRIGAVVVTGADRRIVGILSERDVVRVLAEKGPSVLDTSIAEVMTRKVTTCGVRDTVAELMEQMTEGKFRHLPVVDQGRLAGLVSIGDVVKLRVQEMEQESAALRDYIRSA
jgi:CBS domain-containing protein